MRTAKSPKRISRVAHREFVVAAYTAKFTFTTRNLSRKALIGALIILIEPGLTMYGLHLLTHL